MLTSSLIDNKITLSMSHKMIEEFIEIDKVGTKCFTIDGLALLQYPDWSVADIVYGLGFE